MGVLDPHVKGLKGQKPHLAKEDGRRPMRLTSGATGEAGILRGSPALLLLCLERY